MGVSHESGPEWKTGVNVEKKEPEKPRICVECRWSKIADDAHRNPTNYRCTHPVLVDLVMGRPVTAHCQDMREQDWECGPTGKLWEPKGQ